MKREEDLVKAKEAVVAAIDNLPEEVASTPHTYKIAISPVVLCLMCERSRQCRTEWLRWLHIWNLQEVSGSKQ